MKCNHPETKGKCTSPEFCAAINRCRFGSPKRQAKAQPAKQVSHQRVVAPTRERRATTKLTPRPIAPTKSGPGGDWIAVEDSLPDDEMTVLMAFEDGEVWTGYLDGGEWRYVSGDAITVRVTHWMEFPEPPDAAPSGQRAGRRNEKRSDRRKETHDEI